MGGTSQKLEKKKKSAKASTSGDALLAKRSASKNGKASNGVSKKGSKGAREAEKVVAKKRAKKSQDEALNKKRTRASKKKKKALEEDSSDDEEANEEAEVDDDDVAERDDQREAVSEDEDDADAKKANRTPEEIEEAKKARLTQVRRKARNRGYRHVSKQAGYSPHYVSPSSHFDVSLPVLSDAETIRACQWAPQITDKAAYTGIDEFAERTQLSFESLPKSAAKVIRQSGEAYLRRLTLGAMQRASDQHKTRASAREVQAETRPLQRIQKYSFVAPLGLVRSAQAADNANSRIGKFDEDVEQLAAEKKGLYKEQGKVYDTMYAEKMARKKRATEDEGDAPGDQGAEESIAKKRKKRTAAV